MQENMLFRSPLQRKVYQIIFEADTRAGRTFDIGLLIAIILSVLVVIAESMQGIVKSYGSILKVLESIFTILFTLEFLLRLWAAPKPTVYLRSFFGIIDLLSILPGYLQLLRPGAQVLSTIRILRILRIFRVLGMAHYLNEGNFIVKALHKSRAKIAVFMVFVVILVTLLGAIVYAVENPYNDSFSDIPTSIYWAVVTLTTVGYGDISPVTITGRFLATVIMILGYAIIAVPTGIVSAEAAGMVSTTKLTPATICPHCHTEGHDSDARFCKQCGGNLES